MGRLLTNRTVALLWIVATWLTATAVWTAAGLTPGATKASLIGNILAAVVVTGFASWATARRLSRAEPQSATRD